MKTGTEEGRLLLLHDLANSKRAQNQEERDHAIVDVCFHAMNEALYLIKSPQLGELRSFFSIEE